MIKKTIKQPEYDPYNPILYSNDKQIIETLQNLFFGELICKMLELPSMKLIKDRQIEFGRIANIDKPFIIKKIKDIFSEQNTISELKQNIDNKFRKVKMDLLLGKGELAFESYLKFKTNISYNEIFSIKKDNTESYAVNLSTDIENEEERKAKK